MIKLFTNRELSDCLMINPARWKRWSREFLPPDPLAGRQSGYARQYYLNDAFLVFLGGHMVGALRLSIPEARQIMTDLESWLGENGYRFDPAGGRSGGTDATSSVIRHEIAAYPNEGGGFVYRVRSLLGREAHRQDGNPAVRETFYETWMPENVPPTADRAVPIVIAVSRILEKFAAAVDPDAQLFPHLHHVGGVDAAPAPASVDPAAR